jgi:methylase of polypeptide subunit release factors
LITIQELFLKGKSLLSDFSQPALEAKILLLKSCTMEEEEFLSSPDRKVTRKEERGFYKLASKRRAGFPLAYVTGIKEFWSIPFRISPGVLIPRPETELIVERVLELAAQSQPAGLMNQAPTGQGSKSQANSNQSAKKQVATSYRSGNRANVNQTARDQRPVNQAPTSQSHGNRSRTIQASGNKIPANRSLTNQSVAAETIVDIGTGCGNIAISLAKELPEARILATDISRKALTVARLNSSLLETDNVTFAGGCLFSPLRRLRLEKKCDFIVSNPPYVSEQEWVELGEEIRNHEPKKALVPGMTGLEIIKDLVKGSPLFLKPGGYLVFEIGEGQKKRAFSLFNSKWGNVSCFNDFNGIPRVVVARTI